MSKKKSRAFHVIRDAYSDFDTFAGDGLLTPVNNIRIFAGALFTPLLTVITLGITAPIAIVCLMGQWERQKLHSEVVETVLSDPKFYSEAEHSEHAESTETRRRKAHILEQFYKNRWLRLMFFWGGTTWILGMYAGLPGSYLPVAWCRWIALGITFSFFCIEKFFPASDHPMVSKIQNFLRKKVHDRERGALPLELPISRPVLSIKLSYRILLPGLFKTTTSSLFRAYTLFGMTAWFFSYFLGLSLQGQLWGVPLRILAPFAFACLCVFLDIKTFLSELEDRSRRVDEHFLHADHIDQYLRIKHLRSLIEHSPHKKWNINVFDQDFIFWFRKKDDQLFFDTQGENRKKLWLDRQKYKIGILSLGLFSGWLLGHDLQWAMMGGAVGLLLYGALNLIDHYVPYHYRQEKFWRINPHHLDEMIFKALATGYTGSALVRLIMTPHESFGGIFVSWCLPKMAIASTVLGAVCVLFMLWYRAEERLHNDVFHIMQHGDTIEAALKAEYRQMQEGDETPWLCAAAARA